MKAAVLTRYGPPEFVRIAEVDTPSPKDDELLVKVRATTVNRTDCGYRAAKPFILRFFTGLKPKGTYLSSDLGPFPQNPILALITPLFGGKKVLFAFPKHDQELVRYIKGLIESGAFKPVIDRQYPLDEIVDAYRYVETGQKIGNVVIRVAGSADQPR